MPPKQLTLPGPLTRKHNNLARARFRSGSTLGCRAAVFLMSQIRKGDDAFQEFEISANLLCDYKLGRGNRKSIENMLGDVIDTSVFVLVEGKYRALPFFGEAVYDPKTKKLTAYLNKNLAKYLLNIDKFFVDIPVLEFVQLTSPYTQKIYEYLLSWKSEPKTSIEIRDLHDLLRVPDVYRKDFAQLRRKILDPAKKQINEKTSLCFEYETLSMTAGRGKGRKITHLNFLFDQAMIQKTKTPYYKFQRASKKRQKELHREFLKTFETMPAGVRETLSWLKDPLSAMYLSSFKGFLKDKNI